MYDGFKEIEGDFVNSKGDIKNGNNPKEQIKQGGGPDIFEIDDSYDEGDGEEDANASMGDGYYRWVNENREKEELNWQSN